MTKTPFRALVPSLVLVLVPALVRAQEQGAELLPEVQVPFGCGYAFPISQTHNVGSHLQNDLWAWDFRMPEGTPIVAARDGVVRMARGESTEGGCDPKFAPFANYVVLSHGAGLETQYLHFSEVVVQVGDHVKAGDLIGYSGKTGWACGAHLHFKVAHPVSVGWNNPSVPARIAGYGDPNLEALVTSPTCEGRAFIASRPPSATPREAVKAALASAKGAAEVPLAVPAAAKLGASGGSVRPAAERPAAVPASLEGLGAGASDGKAAASTQGSLVGTF